MKNLFGAQPEGRLSRKFGIQPHQILDDHSHGSSIATNQTQRVDAIAEAAGFIG